MRTVRGDTRPAVSPSRWHTVHRQMRCVSPEPSPQGKPRASVLFNDRFGVRRHDLGGFDPGLDFILQLEEFSFREVLHLSMQELLGVPSFGEIQRTPFIGILKDEPFTPLHGFFVRLSFHRNLPFLQPAFPTPALTRAGRGGCSLTHQQRDLPRRSVDILRCTQERMGPLQPIPRPGRDPSPHSELGHR
jgi:hypothetical protein